MWLLIVFMTQQSKKRRWNLIKINLCNYKFGKGCEWFWLETHNTSYSDMNAVFLNILFA